MDLDSLWREASEHGYASLDFPASQYCDYWQIASPLAREILRELHMGWQPQRQLWEYAYIIACLRAAGLLRDGARGIGFGVGREPLASFFAAHGCEIVATDIDP